MIMSDFGLLKDVSEEEIELLRSFRDYPSGSETKMFAVPNEQHWDEVFTGVLLVLLGQLPGKSFTIRVTDPTEANVTHKIKQLVFRGLPGKNIVIPESPEDFVEHDQVTELCDTFGLKYDYICETTELKEGEDKEGEENDEGELKTVWDITFFISRESDHLSYAENEKSDILRFNGYPEDAVVIRQPHWVEYHVKERIKLQEVKKMYREIALSYYEPAPKARSIRKARADGRENREVLSEFAEEWDYDRLESDIETIALRRKKKWLKLATGYADKHGIDHKEFMA